jgi:hypothetical protein
MVAIALVFFDVKAGSKGKEASAQNTCSRQATPAWVHFSLPVSRMGAYSLCSLSSLNLFHHQSLSYWYLLVLVGAPGLVNLHCLSHLSTVTAQSGLLYYHLHPFDASKLARLVRLSYRQEKARKSFKLAVIRELADS